MLDRPRRSQPPVDGNTGGPQRAFSQPAREAVAAITQADPKATRADLAHVAKSYEALVRHSVQVSHDPALVDGQISYKSLRTAIQRAWLAAAAVVANCLSRK